MVDASIYNTSKTTGIVGGSSDATDLLNELRTRKNEKIGITTQTLYVESINAMEKGIKAAIHKILLKRLKVRSSENVEKEIIEPIWEILEKKLKEKDNENVNKIINYAIIEALFDNDIAKSLDHVANICEKEVKKLFRALFQYTSQELEGKKLQDAEDEIKKLSKYIKVKNEIVYKDENSQRKEAERRANLEIKEHMNKQLWGDLFEKCLEQVWIESRQVEKFMSKEPNAKKFDSKKSKDGNSGDKRILAEFAVIKSKHEKNKEPIDFYIASYDTGFFSPQFVNGKKSDVVTKEIKKRFGIICDHPGEIIRQCFSDK